MWETSRVIRLRNRELSSRSRDLESPKSSYPGKLGNHGGAEANETDELLPNWSSAGGSISHKGGSLDYFCLALAVRRDQRVSSPSPFFPDSSRLV